MAERPPLPPRESDDDERAPSGDPAYVPHEREEFLEEIEEEREERGEREKRDAERESDS